MIVIVYRVDVAVESRWGVTVQRWVEWSWTPSACSSSSSSGFWFTTRTAGQPVRVKAPLGSRFDAATGRLVTYSAPSGLDAASVAHCAHRRLNWFALAGDELPEPVEPIQPPAAAELPAIAEATPSPEDLDRWGISFQSHQLPSLRSWLADRDYSTGPLVSTNDRARAMTWTDPGHALGWLQGAGLDPGKPLPIGTGFLFPQVCKIRLQCAPGIEFEIPRTLIGWPAPSMPPATSSAPPAPAVTSRPGRDLAGQGTFAFSD